MAAAENMIERIRSNDPTLTRCFFRDLNEQELIETSIALRENTSVSILTFDQCSIGNHMNAAKHLSETLATIKTIETFVIIFDFFEDDAVCVNYLMEALSVNTSIKTLRIDDCFFCKNSGNVRALSKALEINRTINFLSLCDDRPEGDDCIDTESLKYLSEALKTNSSIETFIFICNRLGKCSYEGLKYFSEGLEFNKSIKTLDLSWNYLGECIDEMKHISHALGVNTIIQNLDLSCNYIGTNSNFSDVDYISRALSINETITDLDYGYNHLHTNTTNFLNALLINTSIQVLDMTETIDENNIDDGLMCLSKLLNKNKIQELVLNNNNIGTTPNGIGFTRFSESLSTNTSLVKLYLCDNEIGTHSNNLKCMVDWITSNATIKVLDISSNKIGENIKFVPDVNLLLSSLMKNTAILDLDLSHNYIGASPTYEECVLEGLHDNYNIHKLSLCVAYRGNAFTFTKAGAKIVEEYLSWNKIHSRQKEVCLFGLLLPKVYLE